jgi:hypothetical protein
MQCSTTLTATVVPAGRRVQATGAVRPAPSGSRIPLLPRRGATSRLARSGEQRSGAPPAGLGLDGEPPGSRMQVSRGVGGRNVGHHDTRDRGAEGGIKRPRLSLGDALAFGSKRCSLHVQASARGTDAERASRFEGPGG